MPFSIAYSKALSIHPPSQPESLLSQSTICDSLKLIKLPVFFACWPSIDPTAEKAQQEPHCCWLFTGVTIPEILQSTEEGRSGSSEYSIGFINSLVAK